MLIIIVAVPAFEIQTTMAADNKNFLLNQSENLKKNVCVLTGHHGGMDLEYDRMVHIHHCMEYEYGDIVPILSYRPHDDKHHHPLEYISLFLDEEKREKKGNNKTYYNKSNN